MIKYEENSLDTLLVYDSCNTVNVGGTTSVCAPQVQPPDRAYSLQAHLLQGMSERERIRFVIFR